MMAVWAATALLRCLSCRLLSSWFTIRTVISSTSSPATVSVVSEWLSHQVRTPASARLLTISPSVSSVTRMAASHPAKRAFTRPIYASLTDLALSFNDLERVKVSVRLSPVRARLYVDAHLPRRDEPTDGFVAQLGRDGCAAIRPERPKRGRGRAIVPFAPSASRHPTT